MKRLAAICFCLALAVPVLGRGSGSTTTPLEMTITDSSSYAVGSDGLMLPYADHSMNSGYDDSCVGATLSSNGFTQISLDYLIKLSPKKSVWCNPYTFGSSGSFTGRTWSMMIADSTACGDLGLSGSPTSPCTFKVPTSAEERILPGSVFSSTSTQVTFQFNLNGSGYSVQTDGSASISVDPSNSNSRDVTYNGTAKLYQSGTAISGSFSFPFQLVITLE